MLELADTPFLRSCKKKHFIVLHLCNVLSSYFKCFNYILSCPSTKFNLLMWHFCYTVFFIYRTIMFYTTISLIKYLCMCLFVVAMAVLVMVSKAESIVLYLSSCIYMYTCQNKDFLPSFPQRFAPGIDADKVHKRSSKLHNARLQCLQKKKFRRVR